jgi:hypothetical protein
MKHVKSIRFLIVQPVLSISRYGPEGKGFKQRTFTKL